MDIYCPACGKKGRIDDAKIPDNGIFARCPGCKKKLWVNKADGVSLAEEPSSRTPSPVERPPAAEPAAEVPADSPPGKVPSTETGPHQDETSSGTMDQRSESAIPSAASTPTPGTAPEPPAPQPRQTPPTPGPTAGFELSPLSGIQEQPGIESQPGEYTHGILCSECGNHFPDSEIVRFGETMVCATCKPQYIERIRTGVSKPGTLTYGGFWIRFVAKMVDGLVLAVAQSIIITPLMMLLFKSAISMPDSTNFASVIKANALLYLISLIMGAAYTTLFVGKYQATPGKMTFGLMVVAPDGGKISYMRALGRYFAEIVTGFTFTIGYIMAGFDSQKRSLHDRICATRVIRK